MKTIDELLDMKTLYQKGLKMLGTPKPPLGVTPKWLHDENRFIELCACITRHPGGDWKLEWLNELGDLCLSILLRKKEKKKLPKDIQLD